MRKITILIFIILSYEFGHAQIWESSNFFSSNDDVSIDNIKVDNVGNYYVNGVIEGTYSDEDTTIVADGKDIFLAKYDNGFNKIWLRVIGGTSNDQFPSLELDDNNDAYLQGTFQGTCKFSVDDSLIADFIDVFLVKYNSNGIYQWSSHIGSNSNIQIAQSITVDRYGDIIGSLRYRNSVTTEDTTISGRAGVYNNLLYKLGNDGTVKKINNIVSSSTSLFTSIKAFSDGYYIDGQFQDSLYLDVRPINSFNSTKDVFLYKTDFNFEGQWVRRSYGNANDFTGTITQDNYGNVYYTGFFNSDTLKVDSTGTYQSNAKIIKKGNSDIYITKYNKSGNLIWLKGFGGEGKDWAQSIKQRNDYLFLSGYFSDTIIYRNDTLISSDVNDLDFFIGYSDLNGNELGAKTLSTSGVLDNDSGTDLLINDDNSVVVSGYFKSENITIGDIPYNNSNPGFKESFIAKYIPALTAVYTKKQNATCNGQADGELTVTPYFGVAPYTYSWSHNGSLADSTATGLGPGTYSVTITDAVDSTAVVSYDVTEPDVVTFNAAITEVTQCSYSKQGAIDLNMAGGNGGFEYQWQASDGGYGVALQVEDQSVLTIGTYNLSVTDAKGCTADTTIYITGPEPVTFSGSAVTDSSTSGAGEINLFVQGGSGAFIYNWDYPDGGSETTQDIVNLSPGNYTVTVIDGNLCEFDTLFNVKNAEDFYIYITDFKDACQGTINGRARVSYYSPDNNTDITYQWDNVGNDTTAEVTNLAPGSYYHVTVTDVTAGKVRVDSVFIDELAYTFDGFLSGTGTLNCFGDANGYIDLTIDSEGELPYNYSWSTGASSQDLTNLGIGNYSVTVTDDNECTFSITNYSIDQPTVVSAVAEIVNEPSCNGDFNGEVTVDRSGGTAPYTYQWDDPGFQDTRNADGLDAGYYTVTVQDVNNCSTSSGISLTEPDAINVNKFISNELCNGAGEAAIGLSVSGGTPQFNYLWSTTEGSGLVLTDQNQSGLTAGTYYVTATDDNNCTFEDSANITEPPLLEITDEAKTNVNTCNGDLTGSITITATGGTGVLTYTLNPGALQTNTTGNFTDLGAGTYTVGVVDENDCSVTSGSLVITEPAAMALTEDDVSDASCNGVDNGNIHITVTGGTIASDYTYVWSTTDGSGLEAGAADQTTVGAGTYYLTVTDDNACEITSDFTLTEPAEIVITKTIYPPSCDGASDGVIVVNHTGGVLPFSYFWSTTDGSGLDPVNRNQGGLSEGTYELEITDALGCVVNDESVITDPAPITIDSQSTTDASGSGVADGSITVTASGGTGVLTYVLRPSNISNQTGVFNTVAQGEYVVEVSDEDFCGPAVSDTLTVGAPNAVNLIYNSDLIKVYPNPTSGTIYVELDISDTFTLELTSISGQLLFQDEIVADGFTKEEIDLSIYSKGVYIIRIYNTEYYITNRVIVQ